MDGTEEQNQQHQQHQQQHQPKTIVTSAHPSNPDYLSHRNFLIRIGHDNGREVRYDMLDTEKTKLAQLPPGVTRSVEGFVLVVDGVHEEASEDDLLNEFEGFGTVIQIDLSSNRKTGMTNGYAFIKYDNFKSADNARKELNGSFILEQPISVDWAFSS